MDKTFVYDQLAPLTLWLDDAKANHTPHELEAIAEIGAHALSTAIAGGLIEPEAYAAEFIGALSPEAQLHVFFQIVGQWLDGERDDVSKAGKVALIGLEEVMGPDYAQALYRFAVRFTRTV